MATETGQKDVYSPEVFIAESPIQARVQMVRDDDGQHEHWQEEADKWRVYSMYVVPAIPLAYIVATLYDKAVGHQHVDETDYPHLNRASK